MSDKVEYFDKFANILYHNRDLNMSNPDSKNIFPYRIGSYYIYEANNKTKQFKTSIFMNTTSQDVMALYPQYIYEAFLKTATGHDDLKFKVSTV